MRSDRKPLLIGALAGMELCWRGVWAHYATISLFDRVFPLSLAAGVLLAALLLTEASRDRGWRVAQVLALQVVGLAAAALLLVYAQERPPFPLWNLHWIEASWNRTRETREWFEEAAALFWAALFWMGGVSLARRPTAYPSVCARFDLGIAAFFCLFMVRWLVRANGGPELGGSKGELLLASYFAFSLFAVGLARIRGTGQARLSAGHGGLGLLLGAAVGTVFLGTAVTLLFLPHLTVAAERSYAVLRTAAEPLGQVIVRVLGLWFGGRRGAAKAPSGSGEQGLNLRWNPAASSGGGGWERFAEAVLRWGMGALAASLVLAGSAWGAWKLTRWLLSRTSDRREVDAPRRRRSSPLEILRLLLLTCAARMLRWRRGGLSASRLYVGLRAWGLRGGVAPAPCETPLEYAGRLTRQFPSVKREIELIVDAHVQEVYGGRACDRPQLVAASRARARLSSPLLWRRRLRSWLLPASKKLTFGAPGAPPRFIPRG